MVSDIVESQIGRIDSQSMLYEYIIEHYGAIDPDPDRIMELVGQDIFGTEEYLLSVNSTSSVVVAISRTDASRIAFAKTMEYMLTISESVVVHGPFRRS